jgi:hypothetical protein
MIIRLSGLQEASRRIEIAVIGLIDRAKKIIQQEVNELELEINSRLDSDIKGHLKIETSGDSIILSLPYVIGTTDKGKTKISARKKHNPYWSQFRLQPFQDVLASRGYTNISPGRGEAIEPSRGSAPNVRITAKLPDSIIQEIVRS